MVGVGVSSKRQIAKEANAILQAGEVLPIVKKTPVLAGVCATDPFRSMDRFLVQLKDLGFAG